MINNTVIIWILIPVALSGILALLQRFAKLSTAIVLVSSALLTVLAFILPEDLILSIGSRQIAFADSLEIFGRVLKITKANLSLVGGIYLCVFLWNSLARKLETSQWFNALSLLIASLWISALAVQPFLYASVIILLVAVVSIPLLSPRGSRSGAGVLRYVTLQAIAMPLILLSAWMLSDIETAPSASALILRATVLILGGFAIWLALFPVHTWLPMVGQESHPWTLSFLLVVMQSSLTVFFIYFFEEYAWLRNLPNIWEILRWAGIGTIFIASLLLSFQNQIRRLLAYFYLWETGYALLAIGLAQDGGLHYLPLIFMPRILGYAGLSYIIVKLEHLEPDFDGNINNLKGFFHRYPFLSLGLISTLLSLSGLPILASFPAKRHLINLLPWSGYGMETWLILGFVGALIMTFRIIYALVSPSEEEQAIAMLAPQKEDIGIAVFCTALMLLFLISGFFPSIFSGLFKGILAPFENIYLFN